MSTPWYANREAVKRALDSAETARSNPRIDRACGTATATIDALCRRPRGFYPTLATRYFDWPNQQGARSWRLWLESNTLISLTSLTAGGEAIDLAGVLLRRSDDVDEPPFTHLEMDLSTSAAFRSGSTHQRSIAATGLFGYRNDEQPAGALAEALDASETAVDVTNSAAIGVGDLIRVGAERMVVTEKAMLDSGQNLQVSLTASLADVAVVVSNGAAFAVDEVLLIDAERMLIYDIAGNTLIVKRAWDGSVVAAHTAPTADIYAARTLTVERGALGTTAAAHDSATAINRWVPPPLVEQYAVALAMVELEAQSAAYAGTRGSGESTRAAAGGTLEDLCARVTRAHRRKLLIGAV